MSGEERNHALSLRWFSFLLLSFWTILWRSRFWQFVAQSFLTICGAVVFVSLYIQVVFNIYSSPLSLILGRCSIWRIAGRYMFWQIYMTWGYARVKKSKTLMLTASCHQRRRQSRLLACAFCLVFLLGLFLLVFLLGLFFFLQRIISIVKEGIFPE